MKESNMHLVYQFRDTPTGRSKRGKWLQFVLVHIIDNDECLCGISPNQTQRKTLDGFITIPGTKLYGLSLAQAEAWIKSSNGSGSFNLILCWGCGSYAGYRELPESISEIIERIKSE